MLLQDTLGGVAPRTPVLSAFVVAFVVVGTLLLAWLARWPVTRAGMLAPVFVFLGGGLAFWGLVGLQSLRDASRPRRAAALAVAFLLVLVIVQLVLNRLGVKLPDEKM